MHNPMHRQMLTAGKRLAKREAAMSQALASVASAQAHPSVAVAACVDFFHEVVILRYSDGLDGLADFLDENDVPHGIGTRTLSMVFEGAIGEAVVRELASRFDTDTPFREAMIDQDWESSVDSWRDLQPSPLSTHFDVASVALLHLDVCDMPSMPIPPAAIPTMYFQGDLFPTH